ncbi:MAG: S8 family serine peptidase [Lachnospirales bacterium]
MENKLNNIFSYQVDYAIKNNDRTVISNYLNNFEIVILVKYLGDIENTLKKFGMVEIIGSNYAIITCNYTNYFNVINTAEILSQELAYEIEFYQEEYASVADNYKEYACLTDYEETGMNTVIGVIDSGIDIFHQEFKNTDGTTRIKYILDFSQEGTGGFGISTGKLYTEEDINLSLSNNTPLGHLDTVGHGTSVTSICAGNTGVAPKSDICVVKISNSNTKSFEVLKGIYFLREVSKSLNKPLSINISMGGNNASHSGLTLFENYLDEIVNYKKIGITIAAGNEGDSGHHKIATTSDRIEIVSNVQEFSIFIFVPSDSTIDFFIEFDNGYVSRTFKQNTGVEHIIEDEVEYYVSYGELLSDIYNTFNIKIIYKEARNSIVLLSLNIRKVNEKIHLYLPILESVGYDTYFSSSDIENTITFPSTSKKAITVSAYDGQNQSIATFSGLGNTVLDEIKPNVAAPGVNIRCADSVYGYSYKTGTSFAAPIVAGIVSLIFEKNPNYTSIEIKSLLEKSATKLKNIDYPNIAYGFGFVCYEELVTLVESEKEYVEYLVKDDNGFLATLEGIVDFIVKEILFNYIIVDVNYLYITDFQNFLYKEKIFFEKVKIFALSNYEVSEFIGATKIYKNQNLYGENVIISFIDTGICVKNSIFMTEGNTRVEEIYDVTENKIYFKQDIQKVIDEDLKDFDTIGHGTNSFSVASGNFQDNFQGIAPKSKIICAKVSDTTSTNKKSSFINAELYGISSIDILKALAYLISVQKKYNLPMIIGIPLSSNEGSHNELCAFEKILADISKNENCIIVAPTGNECLSKKHTTTKAIINEKNMTYLNIDDPQTKISIYTQKNAKFLLTIGNRNFEELSFNLTENNTYYKETFDYNITINFNNTNQKTEIEIGLDGFIKGIWYIELVPLNISASCEFYLPVLPLSTENTTFYSSKILGSITIPGTINNLISVSGYDIYLSTFYKASGATEYSTFRQIDITSPSVDIDAYGLYDIEKISGTSMGVALTIGLIALILEKHPNYGVKEIRKILRKNAIREKNFQYPNNFYGYGVLHLEEI